jgi:glycosyltransferase A (GT-A) superfamily protein (DUF2064 family)
MTGSLFLDAWLGRERLRVRHHQAALDRSVSSIRDFRGSLRSPQPPTSELQILVIAKKPVPGRVKTRLCPPCTTEQAARIAGAALADTLDIVTATPAACRTLVIEGDYRPPAGWRSVVQHGEGLGERIVRGYVDTALPRVGTFLVGMDTPQLTRDLIVHARDLLGARGVDGVLGLAEDGGWWGLGLRDPTHARVLDGVPMSTHRTGAYTLAALQNRGLTVAPLPVLRDVDTVADAWAVAAQCGPTSRFATAVRAHAPAPRQVA